MKAMGESLDRGHVMIFSLWDDVEVNMLWLGPPKPIIIYCGLIQDPVAMAPGSFINSELFPIEMAQAAKDRIARIPKVPDGIFDTIGPRTFDGGYSLPSQVISSTMLREVVGNEEIGR